MSKEIVKVDGKDIVVPNQEEEKVVVTKHDELSSRSVLEKMRKAELVDLVISTEMRLNEQVDTVALRDAKIAGLLFRIGKLTKERDNLDENGKKMVESIAKMRGDLNQTKQAGAANKVLADNLQSEVERLKNVISGMDKNLDAITKERNDLFDKLRAIEESKKAGFWHRIFG